MAKSPFYLLVLLIISSSLGRAQIETNSPLTMMFPGDSATHETNSDRERTQHSSKREREEAALDLNPEESRGVILSTGISEPSANERDYDRELTTIRNFKSQQASLVISKIDSLRVDYPNEATLISLLEYHLKKYEMMLDLRPLDQWIADEISSLLEGIQIMDLDLERFDQKRCYPTYCSIAAKQSQLKMELCEYEILKALLIEPVELERVKEWKRMIDIHSLSQHAFEDSKKQFELTSKYRVAICDYNNLEMKYRKARNSYFNALADHDTSQYYYNSADTSHSLKKIQKAIAIQSTTKDIVNAQKAKLESNYGSVQQVHLLRKKSSSAAHTMLKSCSFFKAETAILEDLVKNRFDEQKTICYRNQADTLHLLGQDHYSLAQAIINENQTTIDHIKKLISFAQEVNLVLKNQCSMLQSIATKPSYLIEDYQKSFHILQKAGRCFMSAYQNLSNSNHQSQELYDRGSHLKNIASIFRLQPVFPKSRPDDDLDFSSTTQSAKHYAELVIQESTQEEERLHYEKVASFLYEKILSLSFYSEIQKLQKTISNNSSLSHYLLEETASTFLKSSDCFQHLAMLCPAQFNTTEVKSCIKATFETKAQANRLLSQVKGLLFPAPCDANNNQNQDLSSWSD